MECIEFDCIYYSKSYCPYQNLALEDYFLRTSKYFDKKIVLVWRSLPAVVMGRFQNPWMECDLPKVMLDNILLVRRQSGGGTVFIDPGNLNFSFLGSSTPEDNFFFVQSLLKKFDIPTIVNERNDILCKGKKISGSAFKKTKDSKMHHLSLLIETDPDVLAKYLYIDDRGFNSKSIASKRSKVLSLERDFGLSLEMIIAGLEVEEISAVETGDFYHKMKSYGWIFGETPKFEFSFKGKLYRSHKGIILGDPKLNLYHNEIWNLDNLDQWI